MDTIWYHISKMKSVVGNNDRLSFLFTCALVVLLTPHSNAVLTEYFLWLITTNQSKGSDRNRLDIEGSLSSILVVKLDGSESVSFYLDCDPDDKLLQQPKKQLLIITRE